MRALPPPDYGLRGRIGLVLPSGNAAAEPELAALCPPGVSLHVTRARLNGSSEADLLGMAEGTVAAASLLGDLRPDVVGFHCTAVSTYSAALEAEILARTAAACGVRVVATSGAVVAALRALGARRIALVTPYIPAINRREVAFLEAQGFACVAEHGLGLERPAEMLAVPPERWCELVRAHVPDEADAVFLSCTAIRTLPVLAACEAASGRPVISSNAAMAWHLRRTLGLPDRTAGAGRLLALD